MRSPPAIRALPAAMKIDVCNHVMPRPYLELLQQHSTDEGLRSVEELGLGAEDTHKILCGNAQKPLRPACRHVDDDAVQTAP